MANALRDLISTEVEELAVWAKGRVIPNYDPAVWRRDDYGNAMRYADYGDRDSDFGWELDHRIPSALGGTSDLANKRPLHYKANAILGGHLGNALANSR